MLANGFQTVFSASGVLNLMGVLAVLAVVGGLAIALIIKNLLHVCQPNEVLVFSGRRRRLPDGALKGYRVIRGGRAMRVPLLERVDHMDLTNMAIEVTVRNAYSKGGIPLTVQGIANIKIPGEEPLLSNSLERFLGKGRVEIMKIAREALEGNLRGVLATLTPEQVNQDKESFATQLTQEAEHDFNKLGLVLDTLKIQNVSDEVGYLDAIGRARSAQIRREAQVAESIARAEAEKQKWHNTTNAELAQIEAATQIAIKDNERRIADAQTGREAMIAKEQADVVALVAQAKAEVATQEARIEMVRRRYQADVVQPAEARRREAEEQAKADAAPVIEDGKAAAQVLKDIGRTYRGTGKVGREVLLMQKLVPLLDQLSGTMSDLRVDRLTVLSQSEKNQGAKAPFANMLLNYSEQIKAATGIDVAEALKNRLNSPESFDGELVTEVEGYSRPSGPPPPPQE